MRHIKPDSDVNKMILKEIAKGEQAIEHGDEAKLIETIQNIIKGEDINRYQNSLILLRDSILQNSYCHHFQELSLKDFERVEAYIEESNIEDVKDFFFNKSNSIIWDLYNYENSKRLYNSLKTTLAPDEQQQNLENFLNQAKNAILIGEEAIKNCDRDQLIKCNLELLPALQRVNQEIKMKRTRNIGGILPCR